MFSFEHEIDSVQHATTERGIDYPAAAGNEYVNRPGRDRRLPGPWPATMVQELLAALSGILRDQAPSPLDSWPGFDGEAEKEVGGPVGALVIRVPPREAPVEASTTR